jgi:hypothetical protein
VSLANPDTPTKGRELPSSCACFIPFEKERPSIEADDRAELASLFSFGLIAANVPKLAWTFDQPSLARFLFLSRLGFVSRLFDCARGEIGSFLRRLIARP